MTSYLSKLGNCWCYQCKLTYLIVATSASWKLSRRGVPYQSETSEGVAPPDIFLSGHNLPLSLRQGVQVLESAGAGWQ